VVDIRQKVVIPRTRDLVLFASVVVAVDSVVVVRVLLTVASLVVPVVSVKIPGRPVLSRWLDFRRRSAGKNNSGVSSSSSFIFIRVSSVASYTGEA